MRLHENKQLFRQSIQYTAQQKQIAEIYIEKDYWVMYALHAIFHDEVGVETVFKGGTALSKCFSMIERFSEDIDLVVCRGKDESNNQLTNKIKRISKVVSDILPEVQVQDITQKMGMNRKTAHTYTKEFNGNFGQVRDVIVVEATWLGYYEPYIKKTISTCIYEMMEGTGQKALAQEYGMLPFDVQVLEPKRTLCEKIMSLVRFSYTDEPVEDLKKKIRHCYDLHQLLKVGEISQFFNSADFEDMLLRVATDDVASFKNNNQWLQYHPNKAIIFSETLTVWNEIKDEYNGDFKNLVFGNLPDEKSVFKTLIKIKDRMESIKWAITL